MKEPYMLLMETLSIIAIVLFSYSLVLGLTTSTRFRLLEIDRKILSIGMTVATLACIAIPIVLMCTFKKATTPQLIFISTLFVISCICSTRSMYLLFKTRGDI